MEAQSVHTSSNSKNVYPLARPKLGSSERDLLLEAFDSGWISSTGTFVARFEKEFSSYIGTRYGVTTSNGTAALHLALVSAGIGKGDEVIVPDLTFVSPANMVLLSGAKPVFADSNREYFGVDVDTVKQRLTNSTKAIIVVHLYGHPVDLAPIVELCDSRNLILIEDCAEAHGALYKGKKVGSFGVISSFSFYGNKLLTTGEGGMCLTNDSVLEEKMKLLRDHGADRNQHFWHPEIGFNYRMTNLQAAIGCAQLKTLDERIEKYRKIAHVYSACLAEAMGTKITPHPEKSWAKCVFWMYTFLINALNAAKREHLQSFLTSEGIETRPIFYPVSRLPPYRIYETNNPVASELSEKGISVPTYEELEEIDIQKICRAIQNSYDKVD
jgi:perosamine synthetase